MMEIARNYPGMELVERIAGALDIEIHELFIDPFSTPQKEMGRLHQMVAKNIEWVVGEAIEKAMARTFGQMQALGNFPDEK